MDNLVTVVIPLFNTERYVAEALESVLSQAHRPMEVVVVDDGSDDSGPEIVKSFGRPVRLISQRNQGPGIARNTGIRQSEGEFLAFLDADDIWEPDKLAIQLNFLEEHPEVDFVFGHAKQFCSPDLDPEASRKIRFNQEVMPAHLPGALLARRSSFLKVGLFPEGLIGSEMAWYMKARETGMSIHTLPQVVYRRRLHDRNTGVVHKSAEKQRLAVLKAALDRRRASGHRSESGE